jgi:hypothetical protein
MIFVLVIICVLGGALLLNVWRGGDATFSSSIVTAITTVTAFALGRETAKTTRT